MIYVLKIKQSSKYIYINFRDYHLSFVGKYSILWHYTKLHFFLFCLFWISLEILEVWTMLFKLKYIVNIFSRLTYLMIFYFVQLRCNCSILLLVEKLFLAIFTHSNWLTIEQNWLVYFPKANLNDSDRTYSVHMATVQLNKSGFYILYLLVLS